MYTSYFSTAVLLLVLQLFFGGCSDAPGKLQREYFGDSKTLTYGQILAFGFQNTVWSKIKDEKGETIVQFKGTISTGLHDFALGKLVKTGDRGTFISACKYIGNLIKTGKTAGEPDITFHFDDYPITKQGDLNSGAMEDYLSSPDNGMKIRKLNVFYMNRYWAEGSDCTIQWMYIGKGAPKVIKISNKHWDNEEEYSKNPENVLQMVFDYTASNSN